MAISPMEGPLAVQASSPHDRGHTGGRLARRVARRVGHTMVETSAAGDEIVLSDAARALADALESQDPEGGSNGN